MCSIVVMLIFFANDAKVGAGIPEGRKARVGITLLVLPVCKNNRPVKKIERNFKLSLLL
jgi:hypothetical protein